MLLNSNIAFVTMNTQFPVNALYTVNPMLDATWPTNNHFDTPSFEPVRHCFRT
jgi:hypothetical protein